MKFDSIFKIYINELDLIQNLKYLQHFWVSYDHCYDQATCATHGMNGKETFRFKNFFQINKLKLHGIPKNSKNPPKLQPTYQTYILTVECLTVPLWYKQQVTFFNSKFD